MSDDLPEPATPETTVNTPLGIVTDTSFRLFSRACLILSSPLGLRTLSFSLIGWCFFMWFPVSVPEVKAGREVTLIDHFAAFAAGEGTHVHHVVGDGHHVRLVLHDQHRVALVAELLHQPGQPPHVVRMKPHARARRIHR